MEQSWNSMLSGVAEANQKAVLAATELGRIAARAQSRLARSQFAAFEDWLDAGSAYLAAVTAGDEARTVISRHAEITAELGEKLVAASQEALEIQVEARDELARWIERGARTAQAETAAAADDAAATVTSAARKTRRAIRKSA